MSRALVNFSSQFGHTTVRRFIVASVSHPSEVAGGPRGWAASAPATRVAEPEIARYMKVLMGFAKLIGRTYGYIKPGEGPVSPGSQLRRRQRSCIREDAEHLGIAGCPSRPPGRGSVTSPSALPAGSSTLGPCAPSSQTIRSPRSSLRGAELPGRRPKPQQTNKKSHKKWPMKSQVVPK